MAIVAPAPVTDNPATWQAARSELRQFSFKYAVQDTRTLAWQPFTAIVESDNLFDAIRGLNEMHYWRKLYMVSVDFKLVVLTDQAQ